MAKTGPFQELTDRHDSWFDNNKPVYRSELEAIKKIMPQFRTAIEIGVGTARFAAPLNIQYGIDPSSKMRQAAKKRGINVLPGTAEKIPYKNRANEDYKLVNSILKENKENKIKGSPVDNENKRLLSLFSKINPLDVQKSRMQSQKVQRTQQLK